MVYVCESCRFVFERTGAADDCPDCGKLNIREASREERDAYQKTRAERGKGDDVKAGA
ncbi:MAG: hypothetical protein LBB57_01400 [Clostridiales Family XIII bacterium]|jgi:predicted RNA-binding Zn-ribbon protein involved in translation (DUF1610 family)|nr:hypothetical protein [Clostridiales Family XIII bacterium]